jgi:hypothetical protein
MFELGRELDGKDAEFLAAKSDPTRYMIGEVGTAVEEVPGVVAAPVDCTAAPVVTDGTCVAPVSCTVG